MTAKSWVCELVTHVLAAMVLTGTLATVAVACDTPVFRYAMYNWNTAPYQVFFFHNPKDKNDCEAVNRLLLELSTSEDPVNLNLVEVDTSDPASVERLPQQVKDSWKRCRKKTADQEPGGIHVIISPWGRELFAGRLDVDTVRAMSESPARKRLGELLAEGKLVAVCISGEQEADNQRVEAAIKVQADLAEADSDSDSAKVEVSLLSVSTTDSKERWFVKNLLLAEPDLKEYAGQPMLFMAYGRGRAMLPYIGKGITAENLQSCVSFLTGDCSCEVKADNPGIDLLMRCNWEAAADAVAANDDDAPARDGELVYHEFDPSELSNQHRDESRKPELTNGTDRPDKEPLSSNTSGNTALDVAGPDAAASTPGESFASRQTWILGGGLAVIVVVVLIGGLFVMRRN